MKTYIDAFNLDGRVAIITGGATGLGFAMAQCLESAGAEVILIGRREQPLQDACEKIGARAHAVCYDITNDAGLNDLADKVAREYGRIDILINNAGNQVKKAALDFEADDLDRLYAVHVKGAYLLTKAVVPHMKSLGGGSVIFISSESAFFGVSGVLGYSGVKAGILGIMRCLASEASSQGIRFNAIVPGWTDTPMLRYSNAGDPARGRRILERTPMNQYGQPEDIGWAALYLASDAARFVTGTTLVVDGGAMIGF